MPDEFDPETAMGLAANIPAVEAAQSLVTARAVSIAMGDSSTLAACVYASTGSAALAQRIDIEAARQKAMNG
jgi:hypothetical protein